MAILASDIINSVRLIVADVSIAGNSNRWSDERIIELINLGLNDLSIQSRLFAKIAYLRILDGVVDYDINDIAISVERTEWDGKALRNLSFSEIEEITNRNWQVIQGTPSAVVYGLQPYTKFKLYPTPLDIGIDNTSDVYGMVDIRSFLSSQNDNQIFEDVEAINSVYGMLDVEDLRRNFLKIFYIARIPRVNSASDELDELVNIDIMDVLRHYVASELFNDSIDRINVQLGQLQYSKYIEKRDNLMKLKNKDFRQSVRRSRYQGFG